MIHGALAVAERLQVRARRVRAIDPLEVLTQNGTGYVRLPHERCEAVFSGAAWSVTTSGPRRFEAVSRAAAGLRATLDIDGELPFPLRIWGGFSFDDHGGQGAWQNFPAAYWYLPAYQYLRIADRAYEITVEAEPARPHHATPGDLHCATHGDWIASCERALKAIRKGELSKVVLSRAERRSLPAGFSICGALDTLRRSTDVQVFAFNQGGDWFMSATPELLFRNHGASFRTHAVAGTIAKDADPQVSAERLLASLKDREEHGWVLEGIRDALRARSRRLDYPATPEVMTLTRLHHLVTPVTGVLRPGAKAMDAVGALHPTAALGGYPQTAAVAWLRRHGGLQRGWYAAPVGWLDLDGNSSLWAAIRSALVTGDRAYLFAGAGIVADSHPEAEWDETELKLATMRRVFEEAQ